MVVEHAYLLQQGRVVRRYYLGLLQRASRVVITPSEHVLQSDVHLRKVTALHDRSCYGVDGYRVVPLPICGQRLSTGQESLSELLIQASGFVEHSPGLLLLPHTVVVAACGVPGEGRVGTGLHQPVSDAVQLGLLLQLYRGGQVDEESSRVERIVLQDPGSDEVGLLEFVYIIKTLCFDHQQIRVVTQRGEPVWGRASGGGVYLAEQDSVHQVSELLGGELLEERLEGFLYVCLIEYSSHTIQQHRVVNTRLSLDASLPPVQVLKRLVAHRIVLKSFPVVFHCTLVVVRLLQRDRVDEVALGAEIPQRTPLPGGGVGIDCGREVLLHCWL